VQNSRRIVNYASTSPATALSFVYGLSADIQHARQGGRGAMAGRCHHGNSNPPTPTPRLSLRPLSNTVIAAPCCSSCWRVLGPVYCLPYNITNSMCAYVTARQYKTQRHPIKREYYYNLSNKLQSQFMWERMRKIHRLFLKIMSRDWRDYRRCLDW
jgi:hypothetical protein